MVYPTPYPFEKGKPDDCLRLACLSQEGGVGNGPRVESSLHSFQSPIIIPSTTPTTPSSSSNP
jgi:hypothetical protein